MNDKAMDDAEKILQLIEIGRYGIVQPRKTKKAIAAIIRKHMPPSVPVSEVMSLRNQCYAVYTAKEIKSHSQFEKGFEMANHMAYHDFVDELDSLIKRAPLNCLRDAAAPEPKP